jgi:hypothetical protein
MDEITKNGMFESMKVIALHTVNIDGLENKSIIVNELLRVLDNIKNTPDAELLSKTRKAH